jgi:Arc/MetJ-type ribon-helix-helix transcriptional regulator
MSNLTIPLNPEQEQFINMSIDAGLASSKAEIVRRALTLLAEEQAVVSVLRAVQEVKEGKLLRGDLVTLAESL